ncbi:hypothetical protein PRZ48_007795 [Zasmidium cellare]|uniref:DUF521 domain protein n=1 Tax=Zasmidium cellare TaxID=395010 RepID=A0ABR0EK96_ZASCE|nr:hypothetical protein PRZ48_007795 [Zasmidium cellare]
MPHIRGTSLIDGEVSGPLLFSDVPLSFWGGTEPSTGEIIDRHHPLSGRILRNHVLAIPSGRGSCTGSMAMLELMLAGTAPLGLVFETPEQIITLGVIVARKLLDKSIPVVVLNDKFASLGIYGHVAIAVENIYTGPEIVSQQTGLQPPNHTANQLQFTEDERSLLAKGPENAKRLAMEILTEFAVLQGATSLVNVSQAHIDACVYTGPASLSFAESLLSLADAKVAVPTSMNSISIDQRRWQEIGMEPEKAEAADRLGNAAPKSGQHVGWGESNAVVFANSVLGARTQKYPDCIDVCIALTGKAPSSGCHNLEDRAPRLVLETPQLPFHDESIFPLLGYCIGLLSGSSIPVVIGMEDMKPSLSDLKAFGAAFATTSSAAMFHIRGITPEALAMDNDYTSLKRTKILPQDLTRCWQDLNAAQNDSVSMVALGNPHFSLEEFHSLAQLCEKYDTPTTIPLIVTTSRAIHDKFVKSGRGQILDKVGARIISDTCWCMLEEPVVPPGGGNIMTNSAKYAHYAPGMVLSFLGGYI